MSSKSHDVHSFVFRTPSVRLQAFVVDQVCLSGSGPDNGDASSAGHALRTPRSSLLGL